MSNIPNIMQAVIADPPGGLDALRLQTTPVPGVGKGEVLIRVAAAGINRADLLQREGHYPPPPGASPVLGLEVAGEVVRTGDNVMRWKRGDKVCALLTGGGYAPYAAAPEGQCLPWPDGMEAVQAAALPEALFTVWANLFEAGQLKPGETVLVHGGASGIGSYAIQAAKAFGATVIATAGNEEKIQCCKDLGAALSINYKTQDFVAEIMEFTQARGVDVVLDMVGGDYVPRNIAVLAPFGRHVSIATLHGTRAEIDIRQIMTKRLILTGSTLRARPATEKARLAAEVERHLWPLVTEKKIKPLIFQHFPLEKVAEAHRVMESGAHLGKIMLTCA